jgi:hypothetical protein
MSHFDTPVKRNSVDGAIFKSVEIRFGQSEWRIFVHGADKKTTRNIEK